MEHLKGQLKERDKLVRQLRRRVRELGKKSHFYEDVVDEVVEEVEMRQSCPSCKKGDLHEMDFKYVILIKCNQCNYEKKRKPRK
jgi:ribosomal protein L44E